MDGWWAKWQAGGREALTAMQQFEDYVSKKGTPTEAAAVEHVTKV
ncbi:hypothetical protein ABZS98_39480 [Streptomyces avermitilis]